MSHVFAATRIPKTLAGFVLGCSLVFTSPGVQSATANSATLQWATNSESDLAGYRVYQGTTPGSYGLAVDVGNTTIYTAQNLQAGVRYYFAITAYDNTGNESPPSIEVSQQISAPPSDTIQLGIGSLALPTTGVIARAVPTEWSMVGVGDLDGDGRADLVWRNTTTGDVAVWQGNGVNAPPTTDVIARAVPTEWGIAGMGDLDGDGKTDIVVRNTATGDVGAWLMNGLTLGSTGVIARAVPTEWGMVGVGDLDGDGKTDIVVRNTATGDAGGWLMNGLTLGSTDVIVGAVPATWGIAGMGDLDGDGKTDIVVHNIATGDAGGWLMNGLTLSSTDVIAGSALLGGEIQP